MRAISTEEFAAVCRVKPTTIRRAHCLNGHYMGIRPLKLPNRLLLWPAEQVEQLLTNVTDCVSSDLPEYD